MNLFFLKFNILKNNSKNKLVLSFLKKHIVIPDIKFTFYKIKCFTNKNKIRKYVEILFNGM